MTKSKNERYATPLLVSDSGIVGKSRKRNLTPFSETDRYSPGKEYDIIQVRFGNDYENIEYNNNEYGNSKYDKGECDRTGISICYDTNYGTVEKLKSNRAHLILAPFNDSGFGDTGVIAHTYCINNNADCNKSLYLLFGKYMELVVFIFITVVFSINTFKHIREK